MFKFTQYLSEAKKTIKFSIDSDLLFNKWDKLEKLGDITVPKKGAYSIVIDPKDESKLIKILGKGAVVK